MVDEIEDEYRGNDHGYKIAILLFHKKKLTKSDVASLL